MDPFEKSKQDFDCKVILLVGLTIFLDRFWLPFPLPGAFRQSFEEVGVALRRGCWLVVSTHLKNISQIGNLPQIGVKKKNI